MLAGKSKRAREKIYFSKKIHSPRNPMQESIAHFLCYFHWIFGVDVLCSLALQLFEKS